MLLECSAITKLLFLLFNIISAFGFAQRHDGTSTEAELLCIDEPLSEYNVDYPLLKCSELNQTRENTRRAHEISEELDKLLLSKRLTQGKNKISFERYNRYHEMVNYLNQLQRDYPGNAKVFSIGKTFEGRLIKMIKITFNETNDKEERPAIIIDAGIHAREWIAPATALYITHQLLDNATAFTDLSVTKFDWYIIPVLNPDGYEYTHTHDRFWRKTRVPLKNSNGCYGIDLNRNFDFQWLSEINSPLKSGDPTNPCDETYAGPEPFSEPEARALRDLGLSVPNPILYLTFHSYGYNIYHSWGYTIELPEDVESLKRVANIMNNATGYKYHVGSPGQELYVAGGGSDDWFKGVVGIPFVYCIELPPRIRGGMNGFVLPPHKIKSTVNEIWNGLQAVAKLLSSMSRV